MPVLQSDFACDPKKPSLKRDPSSKCPERPSIQGAGSQGAVPGKGRARGLGPAPSGAVFGPRGVFKVRAWEACLKWRMRAHVKVVLANLIFIK